MAARNYRDNAPQTTITDSISTGDTSFGVASLAGWPSAPFTAVLEIDSGATEVVLVTGTTGNTITSCTRNFNAQGALSHVAGATFTHAAIATDYQEANSHVNSVAGVHGVAGSVVGTASTQTLTNKTLTSPQVNSPTLSSPSFTGSVQSDVSLAAGNAVLGSYAVQAHTSAAGDPFANSGGGAMSALHGTHATWVIDYDTTGGGTFDTSQTSSGGKFTVPSGMAGRYRISGRVSTSTASETFFMQGSIMVNGSSAHRGAVTVSPGPLVYGSGISEGINYGLNNPIIATIPPKTISLDDGDTVGLGITAWDGTGGGAFTIATASDAASYILIERVN